MAERSGRTKGLSRRRAIALGGAALVAGVAPARAVGVETSIDAFTGGAAPGAGGVTLTMPAFVENGISAPLTVDAPGALAVLVLAPANPDPRAAIFRFGPLAGSQRIATRIRLAESQRVRVIAAFPGGRFGEAETAVEVAVGGCPG